MIILFYLLVVLSFFSFSFVAWRHLREDYSNDEIFSSTGVFLLGGYLGWVIFNRWFPVYSFWGFLLGCFFFGLYIVKKKNMKLFEALDGGVLGLLWLAIFVYLGVVARFGFGKYFLNVLGPILPIVVLTLYRLYIVGYRRFSWYPSGKIGFVGAICACLYFSLRTVVDFVRFRVLSSFSLLVDALVSLVLVIIFALTVYLRSGRVGARRFWLFVDRRKRKKR